MATAPLDLFVSGIQKIVAGHCLQPELTKYHRGTQVTAGFIQKSKKNVAFKPTKKRPTEIYWDTESNSSNSSCQVTEQPVIWVDIVKKYPVQEETKKEVKIPIRKVLSFWTPSSARGLLPDGFQIFLQKNLSLIAEVQMAKRRRSDNRQIFRPQEDNMNWTSNAPRPQLLSKHFPLQKKNCKIRVKKKTVLEVPEGIQGVHLKGREPIKTNPRQPRPRISKKPVKNPTRSEYRHLNLGNKVKRVTFYLPNMNRKKINNRGRKRRRRRTRKKSKVFKIAIGEILTISSLIIIMLNFYHVELFF